MRRWFVLLLIVLLPLRATAGDFMSLGMALADEPSALSAGMDADCPVHLASTEPAPDHGASTTSEHECNACALCFPVAQAETMAAVGSDRLADVRRAIGDDRFLSAVALGLLQPPKR